LTRLAVAALGAAASRAALRGIAASPQAQTLARKNFRGNPVTLAGGPALALGATGASVAGACDARTGAALAVAGFGAGAVGGYDDVVGGRAGHSGKGFKGHLAALREGRITSGLVKVAGIGASALVASALLPARARPRRVVDVLLGAGVIAGTANLVNLLDLRPGRALKAGLLATVPLAATGNDAVAAGIAGASAGLLPDDLDEQIMLGDAGANALGALLGTAIAARTGRSARLALLAGLVALTAASERVSFTKVIERTPVLRELDAFGRRS
jgi:UDP-N-acetylmuramyl pentapeptide phosphotransferase/UDP-N-acetylglucosamine-1-phosphate transferase